MSMSGVTLAPELQEPLDVPDELPLVPVRDLVVFPAMIVPLFVSREVSLNAVEAALKKDRFIFVCAQHDPHDDAPRVPEDVHKLGSVCLIMRQRKLPDGRVKVLVQGLLKATLEEVRSAGECAVVRVAKIDETPFDPAADRERAMEAEALSRTVKTHLEKLIAIGKVLSPETLLVLSGVQDPGRLADLVAANLSLKLDEAQALLATLDPVARLRKIHDRLAKEEQLAAMQARLQSQAKEEISKTQRDYYLREQLRQIQHELGERDGKAEMLAELGEKLKSAGLPAAAEALAQKDLRRLEAMSLDSAEGAVLRSWLETLCELPWGKRTQDNHDLAQARRVLDEEHHGLRKVKERILELLSVRKLRPEAKGPILLFVGPPGVGKTSLARSIARALGRSLARISLGGVRDEAEIRGHRRTYVGALPGRIVQALRQAGTSNPVIVLDEVDKLGADVRGDPSAALLEVLDPELNHSFRDHYLNLEIDLSQAFFIATANTLDGIPRGAARPARGDRDPRLRGGGEAVHRRETPPAAGAAGERPRRARAAVHPRRAGQAGARLHPRGGPARSLARALGGLSQVRAADRRGAEGAARDRAARDRADAWGAALLLRGRRQRAADRLRHRAGLDRLRRRGAAHRSGGDARPWPSGAGPHPHRAAGRGDAGERAGGAVLGALARRGLGACRSTSSSSTTCTCTCPRARSPRTAPAPASPWPARWRPWCAAAPVARGWR